MARQLVILGTSVTLPDPVSVTELAASFAEQGGQLADLGITLQGLTRPDAWGDWTGLAADAFGQSIGRLPAELGDARDAYEDVASALRQYASQLEPVVNAIFSLSYPAEEAEYTLAATQRARAQAIAHGQDPATITAWDIRVADAAAGVSALRGQLNRLVAEMTALASTCTRQVKAAEPRTAHKSLFGALASDFERDVADPLGRAVKEAAKLELTAAAAIVQALVIDPVTAAWHDAFTVAHDFRHLDAEQWSKILGDVAGVLGVLALIPGVDAIAGPAAVIFAGAAAAAAWVAAAEHEKGASYTQAVVATVGFGLSGVGLVASKALDTDAGLFTKAWDDNDSGALEGLKDGENAAASGRNLWQNGLRRAFSPSDIKASISKNYEAARDPLGQGAPGGLQGFAKALSNNVSGNLTEPFNGGIDEFSHSPAGVRIEHVKWAADLPDTVKHLQEIEAHMTGGQVQ